MLFFFTDTFKILATSWFGVLEEALLDLSFWWKVCLPLSGTGTKSSRPPLIAENSHSMRGDGLNQPCHGSVGVELDGWTTYLSPSTTTQLFSLVGTPCPLRSTQRWCIHAWGVGRWHPSLLHKHSQPLANRILTLGIWIQKLQIS